MLRFNAQQEAAVLAARDGFNATQVAMAASLGAAADSGLQGNAAPIPLDAWRRIDSRAVQIMRDELVIFNRLAAASQTPVGVGDLVSFYPQVSDSGEVHVSMDGRSEGKADQALVKYAGTPIPIIDSYARFGWRQMEVIRKGPTAIDTVTVANHQRKVSEKLEDMVLNGLANIVVQGNPIYGLRNFPGRNTDVHGFDLNGATGANWLAALSKLLVKAVGDNAYGKVTVFLNYSDWLFASINEFVAGYPKTILQRLREVEQVAEIVPATRIPANEMIGIAGLSSGNWGTILSAMPLTTRPKARHNPEDDYTIGVIAMAAPQFQTDYNGNSTLVHMTKT